MTARTALYSVAGTTFVFGLEWMTAAASRSVSLKALSAAGRQASHLAWRPERRQLGLARVDAGLPAWPLNPWRSGAAALADRTTRSLLAAFAFGDGLTWVMAADKGRIYPDGDRCFASEDEARCQFHHFRQQQNWAVIWAPPHWGEAEADSVDLLKLLQNGSEPLAARPLLAALADSLGLIRKPGCQVRPLDGRKWNRRRLAFSAGLTAVPAAIWWATLHPWMRPVSVAVIAPPPAAYPQLIPAGDFLGRCRTLLPALLARAETPGWQITAATCATDGLSVTQSARGYTQPSAMADYHPDITVSDRTASITLPLDDPPPPVPMVLPLRPADGYRLAFDRLRDQTHATVQLQPPVVADRFQTIGWSLDIEAPPLMWAGALASLPNLTVSTVALAPRDSGFLWKLKGMIYVSR